MRPTPGRIRFILQLISPWKRRIAHALLGLTFVSVTSLLYPWLLKLMVDRAGGRGSSGATIDLLCLILLGIFAASALVGYFQQVEMKTLGFLLRNSVRTRLYHSLLDRPMSFHRNAQVGELSARATEDVGKLQNLFSDLLSPAYQNALFVAGCLVLMAMLSPAATLMIIALVAAPAPFVFLLSRRIRTLAVESRNDHASANAFLAESLAGIRDIKAFVREKLELRRYTTLLDRALGTEVASSMLHVRVNQAVYLLVSGALLVIFYAGTRGTLVPGWTIGNVIAFYFYSYTMTMAVLSIGKIYLLFQDFSAALGRITDLMDRQPVQLPAGASRHRVAGEVTFDHVSFSYDGTTEVLRDVDLTIGSGEWYLIAGPSGSGKSTLASLLMGFHHPGRGEILVDGIPLQAWDLGALRRQIGYVGQEPVLIHGTLRENIVFSDSPVTAEELSRAIDTSCLADLISSMPAGLETIVGERGYTLSGGQKARIAVARAIIHDPPILVLDEANAMLGSDLERRLWKNLARERQRKTTIVFSHHHQNLPRHVRTVLLRDGLLREFRRNGGSPSSGRPGRQVPKEAA